MPQSIRRVRKQIQSTENIKKITKAMELVSSAKMRKAVGSTLSTRPYSDLAWQIALHIAAHTEGGNHPFLEPRPVRTVGIVVLSSNRGLCGVFNQQVVRQTLAYIREQTQAAPDLRVELITVGKRGAQGLARAGCHIAADFEKPDTLADFAQVRPLAQLLSDSYLNGRYDRIVIVYTRFISLLKQQVHVDQYLPLTEKWHAAVKDQAERMTREWPPGERPYEYIFEPNVKTVLAAFMPLVLQIHLYQAFLESNASEHSARMIAMRNASDAATDLIADLTLTFNKARQAGITQEICEITNSKAALEAS